VSSVPDVQANPEVVVRHDWALPEVRAIHDLPLLELVYRAQSVHRATFGEPKVQLCSLLSIKTGGCPEDCAYCPQSARYATGVKAERLMETGDVLEAARRARAAGATRFCMGAAWREVKDGPQFDRVLAMVSGVRALGMESCVTLGMLTADQARRLKEAGLSAYNHNLDTSPSSTGRSSPPATTTTGSARWPRCGGRGSRSARAASSGWASRSTTGASCSGPSPTRRFTPSRCRSTRWSRCPGHPGESEPVAPVEMVRAIATARILMPAAMVRLSAGRMQMSQEAQLLCMMAGANSLFFGEKLLTTGNPEYAEDMALLEGAGLRPLEPLVESAPRVVSSVADAWAREELAELGRRGLLRLLEPLASPQGPVVRSVDSRS
jgi:biotin synthase